MLAADPYPVKGMMVYKQNPLQSVPNRSKTIKMMEQMEFICTIDITMSDEFANSFAHNKCPL